ncbi:MAG: D-glycerate dehydrogenase [Hyphomicrobiaceae bacterium]|nr:D-glycerate dehydrogenase [Hyphomicrobiaceae bacterium]
MSHPRLRLAVTRALPEPVIQRLQQSHDVWVNPDDRVLTPEELQAAAAKADALIVTAFDRFDAAAIARLPARVRIVATFSVGNEHIDLEAARQRHLAVLSTPDVLSNAVAEMAMLLMLGAARRVHEGDRLLYERRWTGWTPTQLVGAEITGKRLGILGMGRIGRTIARRARGFDMTVHYHNRTRLSPELEQGAHYHSTPEALMAESDVLVLAAPSSPTTRGVVNATRIGLLPKDAIVVNIARGDLIDDEALIAALGDGRVAAAGLDVFANEPRLDTRYLDLANVFLQPHQGSSTLEARRAMGDILLSGIDAVLSGQPAVNRLV